MANPLAKYNILALRLADRVWGVKTYRTTHHWTRLNKCRNALAKFNGDIDKAFRYVIAN